MQDEEHRIFILPAFTFILICREDVTDGHEKVNSGERSGGKKEAGGRY
jgi:hypothetical protein